MTKGRLVMVVGAQFGSEGKGAACAWLAPQLSPDAIHVRVAGPNAGHTGVDKQGTRWALQQVPIGAIAGNQSLYIAAGSEIDPEILAREVKELNDAGYGVSGRLIIDPSATIVEPRHAQIETEGKAHGEAGLTKSIGSTGKGVGAARADRTMRVAKTVESDPDSVLEGIPVARFDLNMSLAWGHDVLIEGTQGYGLGLHTPYYPQVTSSDCRAIDFCAMAGVSPWATDRVEVWLIARAYPIRVAGNSGPLLGETTWDALGLDPQYTTVTKKVRRIGAWDPLLVRRAVRANGGSPVVRLVVTMMDHRFTDCVDMKGLSPSAWEWLTWVEEHSQVKVAAVSTGPATMFAVDVAKREVLA